MTGEESESRSEPYLGLCDGCPGRTPQLVRDLAGPWGAATACPHHEEHAE